MELNESENALNEVNKSSEEVFRIIGQIMVKSDKKVVVDELERKIKLIKLRLKSIESQEKDFSDKIEDLRKKLKGVF